MTITRETADEFQLLRLRGPISQANADELGAELETIFAKNRGARLIIDLARVTHICSAALGLLVATHKKLASRGGGIRLVMQQDAMLDIFHSTRLDTVFEIYPNREEALLGD